MLAVKPCDKQEREKPEQQGPRRWGRKRGKRGERSNKGGTRREERRGPLYVALFF